MRHGPEVRRVGFARGFKWLLFAGELFGRGPGTLVPVATLLLLVFMIQFVPVIGPLLVVMISPLLTAGLLAAFHRVTRGQSASPGILFAGWQDQRARPGLLLLGTWMLVGGFAAIMGMALWLAPQLEAGQLEAAMNDPEAMVRLLSETSLFGGLLISGLILAVVLGGLYFAVPLVFFSHWPVLVSLLWSIRAMLRNWLAFLGFGLAFLALVLAAFLVFGVVGLFLNLAMGPAAQFLISILNLVLALFFQVLAAGAQYVAFREVFIWPEEVDEGPAPGNGSDDRVEL